MKDAGTGHDVPAQGDTARMEELIAQARDVIELTRQPGWTRCFGTLQQTAVEAAQALTTLEDPVVFFRCQGTLAVLRRLVDELVRPIEELRHLNPKHPLAVQGLPCALAFDEALSYPYGGIGKPGSADGASRPFTSAVPPWEDGKALVVPGLDGEWDWYEEREDVQEAPEGAPGAAIQEKSPGEAGDQPAHSGVSTAKPGSRKFKHPWRVRFVDRR